MTHKIGVLGGIGPEGTGEYYNKLIRRLQERGLTQRNAASPQGVVNSAPANEPAYGQDYGDDLSVESKGLQELDAFGVDFIVMVCNTVHAYYDRLKALIKTTILDLREAVKQALQGSKSALILGGPDTVKKGIYRFEGIQNYEPNEEELKILSDVIFNFNKGYEQAKQAEMVRNIVKKYVAQGAETVILACTEFAIMLGNEDFKKINTIDVLVEATIDRFVTFKKAQ